MSPGLPYTCLHLLQRLFTYPNALSLLFAPSGAGGSVSGGGAAEAAAAAAAAASSSIMRILMRLLEVRWRSHGSGLCGIHVMEWDHRLSHPCRAAARCFSLVPHHAHLLTRSCIPALQPAPTHSGSGGQGARLQVSGAGVSVPHEQRTLHGVDRGASGGRWAGVGRVSRHDQGLREDLPPDVLITESAAREPVSDWMQVERVQSVQKGENKQSHVVLVRVALTADKQKASAAAAAKTSAAAAAEAEADAEAASLEAEGATVRARRRARRAAEAAAEAAEAEAAAAAAAHPDAAVPGGLAVLGRAWVERHKVRPCGCVQVPLRDVGGRSSPRDSPRILLRPPSVCHAPVGLVWAGIYSPPPPAPPPPSPQDIVEHYGAAYQEASWKPLTELLEAVVVTEVRRVYGGMGSYFIGRGFTIPSKQP